MFHTPSLDVVLGHKSLGHEFHARSIILRSSSWWGTTTTSYRPRFLVKLILVVFDHVLVAVVPT